jgi:hypothetical protein
MNTGSIRADGRSAVRRIRATLSIALVLATCAVGAIAAPNALAGSTGCTWYGHGIKWGVANGQFCGAISGSGTYVNYVSGNFGQSYPWLDNQCYVSMKVDFYDNWGNWYGWRPGAQLAGCFWGNWNSLPSIPIWSGVRAGYARISFLSYGATVAAVNLGIR